MKPPTLLNRKATVEQIAEGMRRAQGLDVEALPTTFVLTAGPGSGKTHALRTLMAASTGTVRYACSDELSWRQPFAVAADLIGIDLPTPVPESFDAQCYARVDEMCASGPLLLVLDDAHHADAASLELIVRLSEAAPNLPLTVLLARRHLPTRVLLERLTQRDAVGEWTLPPMSPDDLASLTAEVVGATPDAALAELLAGSGGNPMHAIAILRSLRDVGDLIIDDGIARTGTTVAPTPADTSEVIGEHLALLDSRARELIQKLAVWGGPATLPQLAALDAERPAALVAAAQTAIDAGVLAIDDAGRLSFTHDLYAEVTYERLSPALRSVLHDGIADHYRKLGANHLVAHHMMAAGTDADGIQVALRRAEADLTNAPAVAVDLYDAAAEQGGVTSTTPGWRVGLATALSRTGQLHRAAEVAAEGIAATTDIEEMSALLRIRMFALIAQGRTDTARDLIDETLTLPIDDEVAENLRDLRAYVGLLDGTNPVPAVPFHGGPFHDGPFHDGGADWSVWGLVAEGLRRFLQGDVLGGLELTIGASRREAQDAGVLTNTSANVWPALIETYAHGPLAAAELLRNATTLAAMRGTDWMTAYHDFINGGIELALGHLDDASASFESGFDRVKAADMGWTSMAQAGLAIIDILRGEFAAAATRIDDFTDSGRPAQFGFPIVGSAQALLCEARRRLQPATQTTAAVWDRAITLRLYGWLPMFCVDGSRIALRAGDVDTLRAIRAGLAAMPRPLGPAAEGPVVLSDALCAYGISEGSLLEVVAAGRTAAHLAHTEGNARTELCCWEEAACAAALHGDKDDARELGRNALTIAQEIGAPTSAVRIASRLRAAGLRLDPNVGHRPKTGWDALTKTETTVAELVSTGLTGTEIAERLYVSPRTVQTHVSHALAKLGLRTRVELATFVVGRAGH